MNPMMNSHPMPQLAGPPRRDEGEIELATYFDIVWEHRWLIAMITLVVALIGTTYAFIAKPVYEANMLIHVEEEGTKESKNIIGDVNSMFNVKTSAMSEMELIRSRLVVSRAIDNLRLYIHARPKYFPVVGSWFAERNSQLSNPGVLGYGGYAWGAEKIDVSVFNVPDTLLNREFTLTAGNNGQFIVRQKESSLELQGTIGAPMTFETPKGNIDLQVTSLSAKPGAQFVLTRTSRLGAIETIQRSMSVTELGGKQSDVIGVTLQGSDPSTINNVLTEIGKEYMRQNASRKTEEAEKSLAYLNKQLPELKVQLEQAESKYNSFRNANGTIDLNEESKLSLQYSAAAKVKKMDLQQKKLDLLTRYTSEHPLVQGIDSQLKDVNSQISSMDEHIKSLPMIEQNLLRLSREVKVNTDLYTAMLNTAQQLRLVSMGKVSNVRLVDPSMMPERPVKPNRPLIVGLSVLVGLFLGLLAAFFKKSMSGGIDSPEQVERIAGIPVFASIPHSKRQKELYEQVNTNSRQHKVPLLASVSSTDIAVESLRNFRTALQFSMPQFKNNIVMITGATPGMGKSFVSANLAAIMAATGKRVLLVDADLRNGLLHLYFGFGRQDGLSDALAGARRIEQVIHSSVIENMDFISTGTLPPNPSELLLRPQLNAFLQQLSSSYDLVLVDAPPILAVADTMILGSHAGAIYIMTRAGVTTPGEISESMKRLAQAGLSARGILLNDVKLRPGRYGYSYGYGKYQQATAGDTPLITAS